MKFIIQIFILFKKNYFYVLNNLTFKKNKVKIKPSFKLNGKIFVNNYGSITIGEKFNGNSSKKYNPIGGDSILRLVVNRGGYLIIGDGVGISNSTIVCTNKIEIGNYVFIGGSCRIWDTDFHSLDPYERVFYGDRKINKAPIKIGDCAFIGGGSIILKGVNIGENSIIAAGSIVTKNIPKNQVWGGNPAKYIRNLDVEHRLNS